MAESSSSTDNLIRNINLDHDFEDLNVDESSQNSIDINGDNNDLTRFQEVSQNVNYANDDDAVLVDDDADNDDFKAKICYEMVADIVIIPQNLISNEFVTVNTLITVISSKICKIAVKNCCGP